MIKLWAKGLIEKPRNFIRKNRKTHVWFGWIANAMSEAWAPDSHRIP